MIHFNSSFSGWSKETLFPIPLRSAIQVWFFQSFAKLKWIQLMRYIHISSTHPWDSFAKCCKYIPFAHLLHLLLTYLHVAYVAGPSKSCINSNEIIKINLLTVSLSSLYHWGDKLNRCSILMNSDPKTFSQYYFNDTLRIHWEAFNFWDVNFVATKTI